VSEQARILVLGDTDVAGLDWLTRYGVDNSTGVEVVRVHSWKDVLDHLREGNFDVILANPKDELLWQTLQLHDQAQRILSAIPDAVAVVDRNLRVRWANATFLTWCQDNPLGRDFYEALSSRPLYEPHTCPLRETLAELSQEERPGTPSRTRGFRLQCEGNRYLEIHVARIASKEGPLLLILGHDITEAVHQQNKLEALYSAGRELAGLTPDQVAQMSIPERVEVLKQNIRRLTRDLLHYEMIEIRLLDQESKQLQPLLLDGMIPEATGRVLYAHPEGSGVTGYVASTGKSYLCPDTAADPLYIQGGPEARSSLTVPLRHQDQVIGTFNVESPSPNAFGEDDLRFVEALGHAIASALNTLALLSAEKSSATTDSVVAISREVALPVDEILGAATSMLDRYIGHDAEMADKLRTVLASARQIKQSIQKVGEDLPTFSLPSTRPATTAPPPLKGLRVLVADNDERVRRSAHGLLGRWGCVVETARDGREALTMARLGTYDAILADIRLPDVDGYTIYSSLRQAQPRARVILMTGYGYDPTHSLVKARQDGLQHVLFKPFRVDQLRDALPPPPE
jgi:CheY-like chemotaxis protein/GAF domain-containing protein